MECGEKLKAVRGRFRRLLFRRRLRITSLGTFREPSSSESSILAGNGKWSWTIRSNWPSMTSVSRWKSTTIDRYIVPLSRKWGVYYWEVKTSFRIGGWFCFVDVISDCWKVSGISLFEKRLRNVYRLLLRLRVVTQCGSDGFLFPVPKNPRGRRFIAANGREIGLQPSMYRRCSSNNF